MSFEIFSILKISKSEKKSVIKIAAKITKKNEKLGAAEPILNFSLFEKFAFFEKTQIKFQKKAKILNIRDFSTF